MLPTVIPVTSNWIHLTNRSPLADTAITTLASRQGRDQLLVKIIHVNALY